MLHTLYDRFIKPISKEPDQAEREVVLNYLLVGMLGLAVVALIDTVLVFAVIMENYLLYRMAGVIVAILLIVGLYVVARYKRRYRLIAFITTLMVALASCFMAYRWGLLIPTGLLLFSLAIVIAGVLIGARYSVYMAGCIAIILAVFQYGEAHHYLHPDLSWVGTRPTVGDVIGFSAIFFIIALVSWLFNRQMKLSLRRALRSERALQRQKDLLEEKVEKRAQQLEAAQLEKMQEVYRFAELGRLSTALFHDLANHLSSVSLDIEGLSAKEQSDIMRRISQNIGHIDAIVQRVRRQIRGKNNIEVFNIADEVDEVIKILTPLAEQAHVKVTVQPAASVSTALLYKGDIIRFRQIILNLICNAIEAYPDATKHADNRTVTVGLSRQQTTLSISVSDHGTGIKPSDKTKVFRPFYTTKDKGAGIGLFLVQQIVEQDFHGRLDLAVNKQLTVFTVSLPKSYYAKNTRT